MSICRACNSEVSDQFAFCPECGEPVAAPSAPQLAEALSDGRSGQRDSDRASVAAPASLPLTADDALIPVRLQVRLPQRGRINETISLPFRVTNTTAAQIPALEFSVGATLAIQSHAAFEFHLHPGEVGESSVLLAATSPGEHEVVFHCTMPDGRQFIGRIPFTVQEPTQSTQVINYTDARQIHGRVVVGTEGGRLETTGLPLNDEVVPADYVDVLLKQPARVRHILTKQLHGVFQQTDCDRLSLEYQQSSAVVNIGLLAAREISLGRNRDTNDIVLRVVPPDEQRTAKISRQHARLRFEPAGVTWDNLECRQGTLVGNTTLAKSESFRVFQGAVISPAGQLPLKCSLFLHDHSGVTSEYARIADRAGVAAPTESVGPVAAVRIERLDGLQSAESYVLMQGALTMGASRACSIRLDAASVAPLHARLSWFGGSFWLEPLQDSRPTRVDGKPLPMNHVAQLRQHMHVQLGDMEIAVHPFRQCQIDFDL